jgi:HEAT repeat protein
VEITRGETRVETSNRNLRNALPLALAIGGRLARRADVVERLSENARNDPEPAVRLRNLLFLIREHSGKDPTLAALRKACSDPVPEIRLRAAMALGGDRSDVLVELAESLVDDTVSAEAVSALDRELPFERRRAILGQALERGRVQMAHAFLEALGRSGDPAAVDVLAEVMARESGKLAAAAALALGATGHPAAEPPLLPALQREDTQVAAAGALAHVGTAAAVPPLEEAAERAEDKELRRAARQAVAEIHSRLRGASPGQLSLADTEAGQLSLPDAEAGQLSFSTDPAGQLSLPKEP